ncbi:MAG: aspartate kinase [Burkholderiales bacterium]
MRERWVIKLGGSLFGNPLLNDWLSAIGEHGKGRAVVVPGGGLFADAVRLAQKKTGFDDVTAHRLALLAMDQSAVMLAGLNQQLIPAKNRNEIDALLNAKQIPIWLPSEMAMDCADIPASWNMTSDSLAAWLAEKISATNLLLVKSCPVPNGELNLEELARQRVVDPLLPQFAACGSFKTEMAAVDQPDSLENVLANTDKLMRQM